MDDLSDVAAEYSIRAMPTFLLFKDGERVGEIVGANAAKRKYQPERNDAEEELMMR